MKPLKHSPYNKHAKSFFNTTRSKALGYMILLLIFGTFTYWVSKDLRPGREPTYLIVSPEADFKNNIDGIAGVKDADKEAEKAGLAGNMAQGSKGEIGLGVAEAPKGGMANEAPVVGNEANGVGKKMPAPKILQENE